MEAPHQAAWSYSPVPIPSLPPAPATMLLGAATLGGEIGVPRHPQVLAATPGACPVLALLPFPEPVQRGAAWAQPGPAGGTAPGHTALPGPQGTRLCPCPCIMGSLKLFLFFLQVLQPLKEMPVLE